MLSPMEPRWIERLERKAPWLGVPNLPMFFAVMTGVVGGLSYIKPEFRERLILEGWALGAEPWRALTFLLVPPQISSPLWLGLWLIVFYAYAVRLEAAWGDFRFTLYSLIGAASLVVGALLTGSVVSNGLFQTSLFLAFARMNPNFEVLVFFVIPARMRHLAILAWVMLLLELVGSSNGGRLVLLLSLVNYALFFGPEHWRDLSLYIRRKRAGF